jgi:hypothetical protein
VSAGVRIRSACVGSCRSTVAPPESGRDPCRELAAAVGSDSGLACQGFQLAVGVRRLFCGDLGGICREGWRLSVLRAGGSGRNRGSHVVSEQGAGVPHPAVPR